MDEREESIVSVPGLHEGSAAFASKRLSAPTNLTAKLVLPRKLFEETMRELKQRSGGRRESAAIWCGRVEGEAWIASVVRFHHRLCDDNAGALSINLTEDAKFNLYREMNHLGLTLISAIHTHPEEWVGLSWIDERNQLSSKNGFWSLVAPWYAQEPWSLERFGVHIRSLMGWNTLTSEQVMKHVIIGN
jgi:proteasome lid subunit RPN8/RPN11